MKNEYVGKVEIIFVSSDKTEKEMTTYMCELHGPWLAVEHQSEMAEKLDKHFSVTTIPKLVALKKKMEKGKPTWTVMPRDGVSAIGANKEDPEKALDEIFQNA